MIVEHITKEAFKKKCNVHEVDLVETGLFQEDDLEQIFTEMGVLGVQDKAKHFLKNELILVLKHPFKLLLNFPRIVRDQVLGIIRHYTNSKKKAGDRYPISDYSFKAAVIRSFKPESVLEIGTWYGWGIGAIKHVCPQAMCYTINPKENKDANNPIDKEMVGSFFRKRGLDIHQILADSTKFDFKTLKNIDIIFVDGNHKYDWVYSDLKNSASIAKKAVVMDDYIPSEDSPRGDVLFWSWANRDVVKAVDDFLAKNDGIFKAAYWIEGTPVCVLIK